MEIYLLGMVDFDSALHVQRRLMEEIRQRRDEQGALILCEHPAMVTLGREGRPADLHWEPGEFAARQIPVRWMGRGGGVIMHGPGQLAVYPIVPLDRLQITPLQLRDALEDLVIDLCGDLKLPAFRKDNASGIWCRNGRLAEVGLAVESWISFHGLFLNVAPSVYLQRLVHAPHGERITSLAAERHSGSLMHSVRAALMHRLPAQLGYARHHVYTGHPLLQRTARPMPALT